MGALAGLVEKGLVAPDWAEALAPVDDRIATMRSWTRVVAISRPATTCSARSSGRSPTYGC